MNRYFVVELHTLCGCERKLMLHKRSGQILRFPLISRWQSPVPCMLAEDEEPDPGLLIREFELQHVDETPHWIRMVYEEVPEQRRA